LPRATVETKPSEINSIYALSKRDQEEMCLIYGRTYGVPVTALRFFNIYGTRQALSNPYTGVLAIFASRFLNGKPPLINEDGHQRRDFVSVRDVARACRLALEVPDAAGGVFNIGSGQDRTVRDIALSMSRVLHRADIQPEITGKYRIGDIRNCFADIKHARTVLGYQPQVTLEQGLQELAHWLENQSAVDRVAEAAQELDARKLSV
jgi:dTDP-L-rhamnose 4-epimerase